MGSCLRKGWQCVGRGNFLEVNSGVAIAEVSLVRSHDKNHGESLVLGQDSSVEFAKEVEID